VEAAIPCFTMPCSDADYKMRPKWWVILLFIPNHYFMMFPVSLVDKPLRQFWKKTVFIGYLCCPYVTLWCVGTNITWLFNLFWKTLKCDVRKIAGYFPSRKKNLALAVEWVSSIVFAIVGPLLCFILILIPTLVISTSSLEKNLLVGDFLFVSLNSVNGA